LFSRAALLSLRAKGGLGDRNADHTGSLPSCASRMITSLMLSPRLRCKFSLFVVFSSSALVLVVASFG
jgi:hypothetical protein